MSTKQEPKRLKSQTLRATNPPYVRPPKNDASTTTPKKGDKNQTQRPGTPKGKTMKPADVKKDERFENYKDMKLDELRAAKTDAIEEFDFDLAEYIEQVIRLHVDTSARDASDLGGKWMKERVDEMLNSYFDQLDEIKRKFKDNEIQIRENEQEVFNKIKERHILEIEELETERVVQLKIDEESVCGEAIVLQKQARTLAKGNDFEGARASFAKAEEVRQANVATRQKATNDKFDRELKQLLASQENQLQILQDRLVRSIDDNQKRLDEEIVSLQRISSVFVKSQLQKLIVDGCRTLQTNEQKAIFTNDLTAQYTKNVKEFEKERNTQLQFLYF